MKGRGTTALVGAVAGAAVGLLLLVTTHPTSAYTNDAYRQGASLGFVVRYAVLGLAAALLVRALGRGGRGRGRVLAGVGLVIVLALAIVPPALDTETESEKRRAAATRIDDPDERRQAEARAGAIDGCTEQSIKDVESLPEAERPDVGLYCTCLIDSVTAAPGDDVAELREMAEAIRSEKPSPRLVRIFERCVERAER